jgi:hypothetical protein
MWPEGQRITKRPVLLDWIYTALYDNGVPSALVATKAFTERCQQVCKQTLWNYKQMRRRIDPWEVLPDAPTESDLERVALLHLPDANTRCLDLIVGYALFTKGYFDAVVDLISQARLLAQDAGRSRVIYGDLEQAQTRHQVTESNKAKAFAPLEQPKRRRGKAAAASPQPACEEAAEDASMNRFSVLNGTAA